MGCRNIPRQAERDVERIGSPVDPVIKQLAQAVLLKVEKLEQQTAFYYLEMMEDQELCRQAARVHDELLHMKAKLKELC